MSVAFLRGVRTHQRIDAFTDSHPVAGRSRARFAAGYRRFAGILVDIFYDHFLARDWGRYCPEPLDDFTSNRYALVQVRRSCLSVDVLGTVDRMIAQDWLGSYRQIEGIALALQRVSRVLTARIGKVFALEGAVAELTANYDGFAADFGAFFPELQAQMSNQLREQPSVP
jgi:acyl carrier protein phosphodiesterase